MARPHDTTSNLSESVTFPVDTSSLPSVEMLRSLHKTARNLLRMRLEVEKLSSNGSRDTDRMAQLVLRVIQMQRSVKRITADLKPDTVRIGAHS